MDLARAEVDLPFADSGNQARDLARRHIQGLVKRDAPLLRKTADAPYFFGGFVMKNRQELEQGIGYWCKEVGKQGEDLEKLTFQYGRSMTAADYLRRAGDDKLRDFLTETKDLRVVQVTVRMPEKEMVQALVIVVRLTPGNARVIALAEDMPRK